MKILKNEKAIVITGGPGMGKTAIIDHLRQSGHHFVAESGRQIIQHQLELNGNKLPWADQKGYAQEMFQTAINDYKLALKKQTLTFFDRGLPDVIGYLKLCKLPVPETIWRYAKTYLYFNKVFITPPWEEIYINDNERKQSFAEAVATYKVMVQVYSELAYEVIEVPRLTIEERANFILGRIIESG